MEATRHPVLVWDEAGEQHEQPLPDPDLLRAALAGLDGAERTVVTVLDGPAHLQCGGDAATGVVLSVSWDGEEFTDLVDPQVPATLARVVVVAGRSGIYAARQVVDVEAAVTAAVHFAEHRELHPDLLWELET